MLTDSLASIGDLREAGPQAAKELRRLRAEVAAKDAEIAAYEQAIVALETVMANAPTVDGDTMRRWVRGVIADVKRKTVKHSVKATP